MIGYEILICYMIGYVQIACPLTQEKLNVLCLGLQDIISIYDRP